MGKPNTGNAVLSHDEHIVMEKTSRGSETSQYPEERKSTETPRVVASESGSSPNQARVSGHTLRVLGL